jgi:hypothetical protein
MATNINVNINPFSEKIYISGRVNGLEAYAFMYLDKSINHIEGDSYYFHFEQNFTMNDVEFYIDIEYDDELSVMVLQVNGEDSYLKCNHKVNIVTKDGI